MWSVALYSCPLVLSQTLCSLSRIAYGKLVAFILSGCSWRFPAEQAQQNAGNSAALAEAEQEAHSFDAKNEMLFVQAYDRVRGSARN